MQSWRPHGREKRSVVNLTGSDSHGWILFNAKPEGRGGRESEGTLVRLLEWASSEDAAGGGCRLFVANPVDCGGKAGR